MSYSRIAETAEVSGLVIAGGQMVVPTALHEVQEAAITRTAVPNAGVGSMDEATDFIPRLAAAIASRGDREVAGLQDDAASLEMDEAETSIRRLHFLARELGSELALNVLMNLPVDHWVTLASNPGPDWFSRNKAETARMILFYLRDVGRQL